MFNIRLKKYELVLYIVVILSVLNIVPYSFCSSIRYKLMLVIGCILLIYCFGIIIKYKTSFIIRVAYIVCIINMLSVLYIGDNLYDYMYVVMDIIMWMLIMIATYGSVKLCREYQKFNNNVYYIVGIILILCINLLLNPKIAHSYREWTSILYKMYYPICVIPLILISSQKFNIFNIPIKYSKIILILINMILILFSSKRGGTIAYILGIFAYYISIFFIANKKNKKLKYFFDIIIISIISILLLFLLDKFGHFVIFDRLEAISWSSEGTSGRTKIWSEILEAYSNGNLGQKLFGFGYNATYEYTTISVAGHNDYINNLFNFGLISISLQIIIILGLILNYFFLLKKKSFMAPAFGYSLVVFLVLSMVSICISTSEISLFLGYIWGFILGNDTKGKEYISIEKNILLI